MVLSKYTKIMFNSKCIKTFSLHVKLDKTLPSGHGLPLLKRTFHLVFFSLTVLRPPVPWSPVGVKSSRHYQIFSLQCVMLHGLLVSVLGHPKQGSLHVSSLPNVF